MYTLITLIAIILFIQAVFEVALYFRRCKSEKFFDSYKIKKSKDFDGFDRD